MQLTEIKILMTLALVFYAIGIALGKNQRKWRLPRWVHVSFGVIGFTLDMWATWKMEQLRIYGWDLSGSGFLLAGHTMVSTLAILLFLSMISLGWMRKIIIHRFVAWYVFVPAWLSSYVSGIVLIAV